MNGPITERAPARAQAGFTLIELLVVLGVLAVVATIVVPLMRRPNPAQELTAASIELASSLRQARAAARASNVEQALVLDAARRVYWSDGIVPLRAFAPNLSLVLDVPDSERPDPAIGRVRFFPDGTATPARFILRSGRFESTLAVEWLTSEIHTPGRP